MTISLQRTLAAALTSCSTAHYFVNPKLEAEKGASGYAMRNLKPTDNGDSLSYSLPYPEVGTGLRLWGTEFFRS